MPKQTIKKKCTATKYNNQPCGNCVTTKNNPDKLPLCYSHLAKELSDKKILASKAAAYDNINTNNEIEGWEIGVCYFCQEDCNPCSQACGRCVRKCLI